MTAEADTEQVWLVERDYSDKGLVTLTYARTDGSQYHRRQLSQNLLARTEVTAATEVEPDRLEPTADGTRERYAAEAARMQDKHEPDEEV